MTDTLLASILDTDDPQQVGYYATTAIRQLRDMGYLVNVASVGEYGVTIDVHRADGLYQYTSTISRREPRG